MTYWGFQNLRNWESYSRVRADLCCRRQQPKSTPIVISHISWLMVTYCDRSEQATSCDCRRVCADFRCRRQQPKSTPDCPEYYILFETVISHFSLLTRSRKYLCSLIKWLIEVLKTSKIEIPIHVCVQTSVAAGNNPRARLSLLTLRVNGSPPLYVMVRLRFKM